MPGFEAIGEEEKIEVNDVFESGNILFRHGWDAQRNGVYKVKEFESQFSKFFGFKDCLAVTSGTSALKVAMKAMNINPGDEVITQAFTFVATVEAIIEVGAVPVICEIDETLNMDAEDLKKKITSKTKLIIPVHMLGTPADMNKIMELAKCFKIPVLEDTAWGCGGRLEGKNLGSFGDASTFSFDFGKIITTGEGGMVYLKDSEALARAKAYHDHGHENNPILPRWEDSRASSGFNYRMMELQGAVGLAQLRKLNQIIEAQRKTFSDLASEISDFKELRLRKSPNNSFETCDALVFMTSGLEESRKCREALLAEGFGTKILPEAITWHFAGTWDHMKELVNRNGNPSESFEVSRNYLHQCVALPVSIHQDNQRLIKLRNALKKVFK